MALKRTENGKYSAFPVHMLTDSDSTITPSHSISPNIANKPHSSIPFQNGLFAHKNGIHSHPITNTKRTTPSVRCPSCPSPQRSMSRNIKGFLCFVVTLTVVLLTWSMTHYYHSIEAQLWAPITDAAKLYLRSLSAHHLRQDTISLK